MFELATDRREPTAREQSEALLITAIAGIFGYFITRIPPTELEILQKVPVLSWLIELRPLTTFSYLMNCIASIIKMLTSFCGMTASYAFFENKVLSILSLPYVCTAWKHYQIFCSLLSIKYISENLIVNASDSKIGRLLAKHFSFGTQSTEYLAHDIHMDLPDMSSGDFPLDHTSNVHVASHEHAHAQNVDESPTGLEEDENLGDFITLDDPFEAVDPPPQYSPSISPQESVLERASLPETPPDYGAPPTRSTRSINGMVISDLSLEIQRELTTSSANQVATSDTSSQSSETVPSEVCATCNGTGHSSVQNSRPRSAYRRPRRHRSAHHTAHRPRNARASEPTQET